MANNYTIAATELTPGQTVMVRGKTTFSRLARLVEGEALAKSDATRVQNGMQAIGRPYTSVNLAHAEVLFADPANPTREELFVQERRFVSKKNPENGLGYGIDNKSTTLPPVGVRNANNEIEQVILENDLAAGLDVTLVLRVYKPKTHLNCGLSLDLVVVEEPIRYYNAGVNQSELAARGIIFAKPLVPVEAAQASAPAAGGYTNGVPANTDMSSGLPMPAPAPAVAATPPVMQQASAPAPVAAAPVAQPAAAGMTPEQQIAMLQAQLAAQKASGGASAFAEPAAVPAPVAEDLGPWNTPTPVGQGISYSG
ncbi:hypothetical protein [Arthrobacter koreensis]|uniref:hypothetical protein n=1 Tax=Arthrobacter koreensis TaxID=199136 RepID=UPI003806CFFF